MKTLAQRLTSIFYILKGESKPSRHKPKEKHIGTVVHPAYKGTYGFQWSGKTRRPAWTYRAARRNAKLENRAASLKSDRKWLGITRREFDSRRSVIAECSAKNL